MKKLNNERLTGYGILLSAFLTFGVLSNLYNGCSCVYRKTKNKTIILNNKEYSVNETSGLNDTKNYIFMNSSNKEMESYAGNLNKDSIIRLLSYQRKNDTLEFVIDNEKSPEFSVRQDTLEMLFNLYYNKK